MISKSDEKLAIEGPALVQGRIEPRRIEVSSESGLIARVGAPRGEGELVLGERHLILPGLIDFHVHAREDNSGAQCYKETFRSAGEAAIHGGVTAFVDMPNNPQPPVDDASYLRKKELARAAPVDVLLYAGVGPATRPLSFEVPYKAYMGPSVGHLFFENDEALRQALVHYRRHWVAFHAEDPEILRRQKDARHHWERRPPEAEAAAVETAIGLGKEFGLHVHICHLSTEKGLASILRARREGWPVSCEVTPHHLIVDLENAPGYPRPHFLQCNPPIRPRRDRLALLEAFSSGEIDFLATDHAPHSLEENERGISGIPHLDTLGPFLFWLREQGVSWQTIGRAGCENPGRALGRFLPNRYGRIEEGFVGSLTILDTARPTTIRRGELRSAARWSPFEGMTFAGGVSHTVVRGKLHRLAEAP